jgi:hypothetical protein
LERTKVKVEEEVVVVAVLIAVVESVGGVDVDVATPPLSSG